MTPDGWIGDEADTPADGRDTATACFLIFTSALAVLLMADLFQFSWRYQLPALVTLPPAGALGLAAIVATVRHHRGTPSAA